MPGALTSTTAPAAPASAALRWTRVDQLLDACLAQANLDDLIAHGLGLLIVERLLQTGQALPAVLEGERAVATMLHLAGRSLLGRIRSLLDGPVVLIKGPEVAAHYPDPMLRSYSDLDILVPDSAVAQATLLAAGFQPVQDFEFPHTQQPLRWPGSLLFVEVHRRLPWLDWMSPPPVAMYLDRGVPSATGLPGLLTLPPTDHALLVAAHAWKHAPLRRLRDVIDIAIMAQGLDRSCLAARAAELGMGRVWETTISACDALLGDGPIEAEALPRWARHLFPPRERTVAEVHTARWAGALWAPTMSTKARGLAGIIRNDLGPMPGELWRDKLARTGRAVRDATAPALLRERDGSRRP